MKKNMIALLSSQIAKIGIGILSSVLLARFLGAELRGIYAIAISIPSIAALFLSLGLPQLNIIYAGLHKEKRRELMTINLALCILMSVAAVVVLRVVYTSNPELLGHLSKLNGREMGYVYILISLILSSFCLREMMKGCDEISYLSKVILFEGVFLFCAYLFCYLNDMGLEQALLAQVALQIIVLGFFVVKLAKLIGCKPSWDYKFFKEIIENGAVYYLGGIAIAILLYSPVIILNFFNINLAEVACFAIAASLVQQTEILPGTIVSVLLPGLSNQREISKGEIVKKVIVVFKYNFIICSICVVFVSFFVQFVYVPLIGYEYKNVYIIFNILAVGSIISGSGKIINVYFNLIKKPNYEVGPAWCRVLVQLILSFVSLIYFNIFIFAIGITISRFVRVFMSLAYFRSITGENLLKLTPSSKDVVALIKHAKNFQK